MIQQLLAVARGDGLCEDDTPTPTPTRPSSSASTPTTSAPSSSSTFSSSSFKRRNGFSLSIRSEALWMLGRLARSYPWRIAQEWLFTDQALRKCYRCTDPTLRLHAIKVYKFLFTCALIVAVVVCFSLCSANYFLTKHISF